QTCALPICTGAGAGFAALVNAPNFRRRKSARINADVVDVTAKRLTTSRSSNTQRRGIGCAEGLAGGGRHLLSINIKPIGGSIEAAGHVFPGVQRKLNAAFDVVWRKTSERQPPRRIKGHLVIKVPAVNPFPNEMTDAGRV